MPIGFISHIGGQRTPLTTYDVLLATQTLLIGRYKSIKLASGVRYKLHKYAVARCNGNDWPFFIKADDGESYMLVDKGDGCRVLPCDQTEQYLPNAARSINENYETEEKKIAAWVRFCGSMRMFNVTEEHVMKILTSTLAQSTASTGTLNMEAMAKTMFEGFGSLTENIGDMNQSIGGVNQSVGMLKTCVEKQQVSFGHLKQEVIHQGARLDKVGALAKEHEGRLDTLDGRLEEHGTLLHTHSDRLKEHDDRFKRLAEDISTLKCQPSLSKKPKTDHIDLIQHHCHADDTPAKIRPLGRPVRPNQLTSYERRLIRGYIKGDFAPISIALRSPVDMPTEEELQKVATLTAALDKFPDYDGLVQRGVDFGAEFIEKFQKLGRFVDSAPLSSTKKDVSELKDFHKHNCWFFIKSLNGKDISRWNKFEEEVLFKPLTVFFITSCEFCLLQKKWMIKMEERHS